MIANVYDIPRTVEYQAVFNLVDFVDKLRESGDVDYGPHYWCEFAVGFTDNVSKSNVAKIVGDYLAYNYQDNFRQTEVRPSNQEEGKNWIVRVHLAWGDRPYYTAVTNQQQEGSNNNG